MRVIFLFLILEGGARGASRVRTKVAERQWGAGVGIASVERCRRRVHLLFLSPIEGQSRRANRGGMRCRRGELPYQSAAHAHSVFGCTGGGSPAEPHPAPVRPG